MTYYLVGYTYSTGTLNTAILPRSSYNSYSGRSFGFSNLYSLNKAYSPLDISYSFLNMNGVKKKNIKVCLGTHMPPVAATNRSVSVRGYTYNNGLSPLWTKVC